MTKEIIDFISEQLGADVVITVLGKLTLNEFHAEDEYKGGIQEKRLLGTEYWHINNEYFVPVTNEKCQFLLSYYIVPLLTFTKQTLELPSNVYEALDEPRYA